METLESEMVRKFDYDGQCLQLEVPLVMFISKCRKPKYVHTGCSNTIYPFLISNFDTVNIILSIWEFNQFLYMLLGVLSQNVIGMG